ncbi:MAG: hypothetical protein KBF37_09780 [Saprospiraceae bacterium]|jgi:hypothetical protein|nr:hypothetical protein [Saprospiraceae bacterium]MBP9210597.1 hypothetical protein [Saprospiraceae bacterium]MBV6473589.1 hypothetical protein [Saprospiraceae bacterium]
MFNKTILSLMGILLGVLWFSSCSEDDPETGTLEIVVRATYGEQPLVVGQSYDYYGRGTMKFTRSEFFMSHLRLIGDSTAPELKDIDYLRIHEHHTTVARAQEGMTIRFGDIAPGDYGGISFLIGLDETQNNTNPANYPATHPMGEGARYWAGGDTYMFSKVEGVYKEGGQSVNYFYHSGFDDAMRPYRYESPLRIEQGKTTRLFLSIDHAHLFAEGNSGIDILSNPYVHVVHSVMQGMMDRYVEAMHFE